MLIKAKFITSLALVSVQKSDYSVGTADYSIPISYKPRQKQNNTRPGKDKATEDEIAGIIEGTNSCPQKRAGEISDASQR